MNEKRKYPSHAIVTGPDGRKLTIPHNVEMQAALKRGEKMLAGIVAESQRTGKPVNKYATDPKTGRRHVVLTLLA